MGIIKKYFQAKTVMPTKQRANVQAVPRMRSKGSLIAIDPATGQTRWRFEMVRQPSGGMLTTAGGLVFSGDAYGNLIAFHARSGKVLWRFDTGATISAPPISYTFEGKQYVAVAAGGVLIVFGLPDQP